MIVKVSYTQFGELLRLQGARVRFVTVNGETAILLEENITVLPDVTLEVSQ